MRFVCHTNNCPIASQENLSSINESDADNTADLLDNTYNIPIAKTLDFRDSPDMFSNDTPDVAKVRMGQKANFCWLSFTT